MNKSEIRKRLEAYEKNRNLVLSNSLKYVPFYGFNKLQKYIPGVIPGIMYKVTSHMGVGKTKISKFLFVYQTMLYALKYKMNFKVLYFALEESKEEFLDDLMIHLTKRIQGTMVDRFSTMGTSSTVLKETELEALKQVENAASKIVENLEIIDNKYTPTEIYNTCKYYAKKWGKFAKDKEGKDIMHSYTPHDPGQVVLVVVDHISLVSPEFDKNSGTFLSQHATISKWHTDLARKTIAKAWKWSVLNVQQQSLESEKQQFTNRGETIINKILPTLDGLANNKEVGRDDYVVLGLFAPERYSLEKYIGYDIKSSTANAFGDRFRSLHLLKNRFGHPNKILPLYFDGRYSHFEELPDPKDPKFIKYKNLLKT